MLARAAPSNGGNATRNKWPAGSGQSDQWRPVRRSPLRDGSKSTLGEYQEDISDGATKLKTMILCDAKLARDIYIESDLLLLAFIYELHYAKGVGQQRASTFHLAHLCVKISA